MKILKKLKKGLAMLLVSSLFISNIEPITVRASGSSGQAMDTDELLFITLADDTAYRWNANGNGDKNNVIHLDTVMGSNCKFKLKEAVDKNDKVADEDANYYGIKHIKDGGTDRFADIEDKSKEDGKKLHLWESDDYKVKGNEHRQFAFYLDHTDGNGNKYYYIQNRNSGLWMGVEDTNENGKCDKGDKIIQTSQGNRKLWIISKAVVPKSGKETENLIADGENSAFIEIFKKGTIDAVNRYGDAAGKGTNLHLYTLGTSSKWRIDWNDTYSAYTIHAVTGGEKDRGSVFTDGAVVWDIEGEDGSKIHLWNEQSKADNQNTSQLWRFIKQENGSYKIQNARSGRYVDQTSGILEDPLVLSDTGIEFEISVFAGSDDPVNYDYAVDWMKDIPDDVSLASVNIPGTHDTGTASVWEDDWAQFSWTSCQKLYYGEQLNVGARSFDIRCNAKSDTASPSDVMIIHGGAIVQCGNRDDTDLTLQDIFDDSVRFLKEHKTETIIMMVKSDAGSTTGLVHAVSEFIKDNKDYVYTGNGIPSMGEARGKIIFIRRYEIDKNQYNPADAGVNADWLGIDLSDWDSHDYSDYEYAIEIYNKDNVSVYAQDAFSEGAYIAKRDYIEGTMKQTVGEDKSAPTIPADAWVYNYASTAGIWSAELPLMQTRGINPWLYEDETGCIDNRRLGMVMLNFVDAPMARLIYETNFKDGKFFASKATPPTEVKLTCGETLSEVSISGQAGEGTWSFDEEDYVPTWEDFEADRTYTMTFTPDRSNRQSVTAKVAITDFQKKEVNVSVDNKEITYGDVAPTLTYTCDEFQLEGEDTIEDLNISLELDPDAVGTDGRLKAGTWGITATANNKNYEVKFTNGTVTVNPKTLGVTWSDTTNLKYNGNPQNVTAEITGVIDGDDCTVVVAGGNEVGPSWSGVTGEAPTKYTATVSLDGKDAANYNLSDSDTSKSYYILREKPGEDEYQFPEKAVLTYGQTLSEATLIGASGAGRFVFVDKESKTVIGDTKPTAAGTYESEYYLAFVPENNAEGMVVNNEPTTVEVQQKEIKIIINDNDRVYGRSLYPFSYSFKIAEGYSLADGDTETSLGITLSAGEGDGISVNAGTYPITVQSCSNTNYKVTAVPGTLTVLKRPIRLSWNNESTYSYTGNPVDITCEVASVNVQFGDYEGSPCTFRVFCNQKVEVGYYNAFAIITNANYTYDAGNALNNGCSYEIVKADPSVTFPSEISLTYGQTLSQAEFTGADSNGIPGEFVLNEKTSDSSLLTPNDNGTELEVQFVPQDTKNYNVISQKIPLKVSKKTIVVRAEDQKQIYGDEIAEFTWSMDESQLVGDDKKEDFAFTLTAKKGESDVIYVYPAAGLYDISISCDEENSVAETIQNYAFDFRQGSLEIAPRVAEIQWSDTTCIVKDGSGPSATIANLVGPDDCKVTVESDGTAQESYYDADTDTWTPYTAKITGLSGADKFNYSLSASEKDLEISYYVLADEKDCVMPKEAYLTYGQKRSEVKWSAMAGKGTFLIVDRQTQFRVDDDKILSAGEYNDYAVRFYPDGSDGLESDMVYSDITLYVEKKELTVNALPVEKTYGEETKLDFTVDASKLVGEDTKADLGVVLTAIGTSGSEEEKIDGNRINSPVGTYDITMAQCNSANYDVTVVSSTLTIHPKEVSLSWSDVSNLVYSGNPVNVTAQAEEILEGDTCEVSVSNGTNTNPGTYKAIAVSLSNSNYTLPKDESKLVKEYTIKAMPNLDGLPTVAERVYNPNAVLKDEELIGGNVLDTEGNTLTGTWSWKEQSVVPTVGNHGYEAVFVPSDADSTDQYATITETIAVPVKKATPYISGAPEASAITYGETLADSKLSGGTVQYGNGSGQAESAENAKNDGNTPVAGTFAWKDATVKPVVSDSGKTSYTVVFTPEDSVNYETVEVNITLTVNKAETAPDKPKSTMNVPYSTGKVSDVTLSKGWVWQDADKAKALTVGKAVKATAIYKGADKGNYVTESVSISITRQACTHTWDAGKVTKKATPAEKGVKTYTCKVCKATRTEAIPALGAPAVGTVDTSDDGKATYKVTTSSLKKGTVAYVAPKDKKKSTITIPDKATIDGVTYKVTSVADNAFANNKKITKVTIGSNIKTIGKKAFYKCTKLKTVKIGKNVTTIGSNAFCGCSKLTSVTMGSNVTTISDKAFYKCTALTKITIPSKVKKIGKQAFYGCKKLKSIIIKTTKLTSKNVGSKAFEGIYSKAVIKVPKSKFTSYKKLLKSKGVSSKAKIEK